MRYRSSDQATTLCLQDFSACILTQTCRARRVRLFEKVPASPTLRQGGLHYILIVSTSRRTCLTGSDLVDHQITVLDVVRMCTFLNSSLLSRRGLGTRCGASPPQYDPNFSPQSRQQRLPWPRTTDVETRCLHPSDNRRITMIFSSYLVIIMSHSPVRWGTSATYASRIQAQRFTRPRQDKTSSHPRKHAQRFLILQSQSLLYMDTLWCILRACFDERERLGRIIHECLFFLDDRRARRMKARGDTGQIKRAEENLRQIKYLHAKVDAVMAHLQIPSVSEPMEMADRM